MSNVGRLLLFLGIAGCANLLSRELPFLLFGRKEIPAWVRYLGKMLPMAIMTILVLYCIRGTTFSSAAACLPQLISLAVVTILHIWKRNTTLSIFSGTLCYMILIRLL